MVSLGKSRDWRLTQRIDASQLSRTVEQAVIMGEETVAAGDDTSEGAGQGSATPFSSSSCTSSTSSASSLTLTSGAPQSTSAPASASATASPDWKRIAVVGQWHCLFGSSALSSGGKLLGFFRLRSTHALTQPSWEGPGEREREGEGESEGEDTTDRRLPFTDKMRVDRMTGLSSQAALLPLSALLHHILPALASHDAGQGELAVTYLTHVLKLVR